MRAVKHPLRVLAAVACLTAILVACQVQKAPAPDAENATAAPATEALARLRVAVVPTFPPFAAPGGPENVTGFDVDLIKAVAARARVSVSFLPVAQHQLLNGISTCDYDAGISALAMTDVLREQMAFSEPYLTVGQVVVVKKGNITIQGRDQLGGATVGVERGSRGAEELQSIPNAQPKVYPTASAALQDLIAGYVDAVITNRPLAQTFASTPANNLKIAGQEFAAEDYGIALCSQKPELVEQINDGLAAVKRDGTLDKLKQKWFKTR